jgi:hypothetical protein
MNTSEEKNPHIETKKRERMNMRASAFETPIGVVTHMSSFLVLCSHAVDVNLCLYVSEQGREIRTLAG